MSGRRWYSRALGWVAMVGLALAACNPGNPNEPNVGTNTNWLRSCKGTKDCADASLSCLCDVCTQACSAGADCSELGGACSPPLSTLLECGKATPLCLKSCSLDDECPTDERCVQGTCSRAPQAKACPKDSNTLACANFDGAIDPAWTVVKGAGGQVDVVSSPSVSGDALRARWPDQATVVTSLGPFASGSLYGRFWLRLEAGAPGLQLRGPQLGNAALVSALRFDIVGENAEIWNSKGLIATSARPFSRQIWHCVRFQVDISNTAGRVVAYLDEALMVDAAGLDSLPGAAIDYFEFGANWSSAPATLLLDQALISRVPVGCLGP